MVKPEAYLKFIKQQPELSQNQQNLQYRISCLEDKSHSIPLLNGFKYFNSQNIQLKGFADTEVYTAFKFYYFMENEYLRIQQG